SLPHSTNVPPTTLLLFPYTPPPPPSLYTLSLHDALPISWLPPRNPDILAANGTTSSLRSDARYSFCPPFPFSPAHTSSPAKPPAAALPGSRPQTNAAAAPTTGPPSGWFPQTPDLRCAGASKNSSPCCPAPPAPVCDSSSARSCVS